MKTIELHCNRTILGSALTALVLVLGLASQVDADVKTKIASTVDTDNTEALLSVKNTPLRDLSNLRCWQDGKLLFEEVNLSERALASSKQVMIFDTAKDDAEGEVFLIETGSATCLYKKVS